MNYRVSIDQLGLTKNDSFTCPAKNIEQELNSSYFGNEFRYEGLPMTFTGGGSGLWSAAIS